MTARPMRSFPVSWMPLPDRYRVTDSRKRFFLVSFLLRFSAVEVVPAAGFS